MIPSSEGVLCADCGSGFKRHKCLIEKAKAVKQCNDAVQYGEDDISDSEAKEAWLCTNANKMTLVHSMPYVM